MCSPHTQQGATRQWHAGLRPPHTAWRQILLSCLPGKLSFARCRPLPIMPRAGDLSLGDLPAELQQLVVGRVGFAERCVSGMAQAGREVVAAFGRQDP